MCVLSQTKHTLWTCNQTSNASVCLKCLKNVLFLPVSLLAHFQRVLRICETCLFFMNPKCTSKMYILLSGIFDVSVCNQKHDWAFMTILACQRAVCLKLHLRCSGGSTPCCYSCMCPFSIAFFWNIFHPYSRWSFKIFCSQPIEGIIGTISNKLSINFLHFSYCITTHILRHPGHVDIKLQQDSYTKSQSILWP